MSTSYTYVTIMLFWTCVYMKGEEVTLVCVMWDVKGVWDVSTSNTIIQLLKNKLNLSMFPPSSSFTR